MEEIKVAAVDPGTVNGAAWIGSYFPSTGKIHTHAMMLGARIKDGPAYSIAADMAMWTADKCEEYGVDHVLVETAPQWNISARICAASTYGVFVGRRIKNVKYSSPVTKHSAVNKFATTLGIEKELEYIPESLNRTDKKDSAKARLINKRNAVRVVRRLLDFSDDLEGKKVMETEQTSGKNKLDDLSDALLLACGMAIKMNEDSTKKNKPRKTTRPKI